MKKLEMDVPFSEREIEEDFDGWHQRIRAASVVVGAAGCLVQLALYSAGFYLIYRLIEKL